MDKLTKKSAHVIVVSNEKGGTGKSTLSMHLAIKLMQEGFKVASLDLDGRQGTLSKYIENRKNFCAQRLIHLPMPEHYRVSPQENYDLIPQALQELNMLVEALKMNFDAIIIDTPGSKNYLFEAAHEFADTLITPISDSLIDLDVIADIDFQHNHIGKPGPYAEFIWEVKKHLAAKGKAYLNWIVVGNKVSSLNSKNKKAVFEYLNQLAKRFGFRFINGLKDRVIYKELFLEGLTVLDMNHEALKLKMSVSHLAAKREIRALAESICPE